MASVKYFHSSMVGAPVLNGTAGSLIGVLDACLVNGFGLQTATSLVIAGGVATATLPSNHPFEVDTTILVSGATPGGLNGEATVSAIGANTVSFPTALPDQTATGTITVKLAPLGWAKPFVGTNLAAYRSNDMASTRMFLRVDDTSLTNAKVLGYESMSDINTGAAFFPATSWAPNGGFWPKSSTSTPASARAWTLVGDGKTFYLHMNTAPASVGAAGCIWSFGDFQSTKIGDAYACQLTACATDQASSGGVSFEAVEYVCVNVSDAYPRVATPRSYTGLGSATHPWKRAETHVITPGLSGSTNNTVAGYPNGADNALLLSRIMLLEVAPTLRGYLRGVLHASQICHTAFNWRDKVDGSGPLAGRKLLAIKGGAPAGTSSNSVNFFDITGPWV